ncbi:S-transferase A2 [Seminavis robusta]|uniref:S-transferase A2 n=1 Tax=Seminavis robusta TaxID=568900 RepID=A0A9N8DUA5_9STRA|nr:S-transferase A2 [Seminavis robusta]|eukprot:Sro253_g099970.1 S-transferase A2 (227) ;mRNA; f:60921-61601
MTSRQQPKLKLYYFNIVGKGEPIRLLCAYAGLELEDYHFASRQEFQDLKANGKLAFGQVPLLEVDDGAHQLVQSTAILRYLAKLGGLYPRDDDILAAKIDAALAQEADAFTGPTVATYTTRFGICLEGDALQQSKELIAKEVIPRHLDALEQLLNSSSTGWIAGTDQPSPADFVWYVRLALWLPETQLPFQKEILSFQGYPKIKAFVDKFASLEAIKRYYADKKKE